MIERRKYPRIKAHCRVFFKYSDAHGQVVQDMGMVLDISEKGMLLETSAPIHASTIKVMVPVKEKDALEIMGNIIYSIPTPESHYRTGIAFSEPVNDTVLLIKTLRLKQ
jgi:hypothetical protein